MIRMTMDSLRPSQLFMKLLMQLQLMIPVFMTITVVGETQAAAQTVTVKVVSTVWGFDGRVVPGQFMPLSILLDNLSEDAIEGQVSLRATSAMMRDSGGVMVEPVYLAPRTRRWVQFYPYISGYSSTWRFTLASGGTTLLSESIEQPRAAYGGYGNQEEKSQPVVILDRPGGMGNRIPGTVKHMPAEIFPPYSTATGGLRAMYLDFVPDWEEPRQEALISWLRSGGQLHLLLDSNALRLKFSGVLSPLNEPFTTFYVGSGKVIRHEYQRDGLTAEVVAPVLRPSITENVQETQQTQNYQYEPYQSTIDPGSMDSEMIMGLRELTRPEHNWFLIFLLSVCYVGLIFPGCWLISRVRTVHFLTTYAAIAGAAIVFSVLFLFIGRRGYGESTVQHCLSVARYDSEGRWTATQWGTLFVTSGDQYIIESENEQAMMSVGGADDSVDAIVQSGNKASIDVRIPPFSSQAIVARRQLSLPDWTADIRNVEISGDGLVKLEVEVGAAAPRGEEVTYMLLRQRSLYKGALSDDGKSIVLGQALGQIASWCDDTTYGSYRSGGWLWGGQFDSELSEEERFYEVARRQMVRRSLFDEGAENTRSWSLAPDRIRLLILAPTDKDMSLKTGLEMRVDGRTLFIRDLLLSSTEEEKSDV
ncbi:MAG: hypothetical protein JNL58_03445 [Planctomyces sp.]|nr:hypothetical protein [Planctomyces sp.]